MTIVNADMAAAWDGEEGDGWSRDWQRYDRSLAGYHVRLLEAAAFTADDRVLDIGCGNGQTTIDAARVASSALGVDLSSKMLARARERAAEAGLGNVTFEQADAQVHPFEPAAHDIAISRYGSMFFADPVAAFANIGGALAPGGRLVLLVWQVAERQGWLRTMLDTLALGRDLPTPPSNVPGPFGLGDADRTRSILTDAGFVDVDLTGIDGDFRIGDDAEDSYEFVKTMGITRGLLGGVSDAERETALEALRAVITEHTDADGTHFDSAAWLVTARRPA